MLLCGLTILGPVKSLYVISLESLFMFHLNLILHMYIIEKILSKTITRNIIPRSQINRFIRTSKLEETHVVCL